MSDKIIQLTPTEDAVLREAMRAVHDKLGCGLFKMAIIRQFIEELDFDPEVFATVVNDELEGNGWQLTRRTDA